MKREYEKKNTSRRALAYIDLLVQIPRINSRVSVPINAEREREEEKRAVASLVERRNGYLRLLPPTSTYRSSPSAIETVVFISDSPPWPPRRDYDPFPISLFVVTSASDTVAGIIAANCRLSSSRKGGRTDGRRRDRRRRRPLFAD